jgi:hypothetical protein
VVVEEAVTVVAPPGASVRAPLAVVTCGVVTDVATVAVVATDSVVV